MSTTMLRNRTTSPPMTPMPHSGCRRVKPVVRLIPRGGGAAMAPPPTSRSSLLLGRDTKTLFDAGKHTGVGVEELRGDCLPATELRDCEQAGRRRELPGRVSCHDRAVTVVREDLLRSVAVQEVDERLRSGRVLRVLRDGNRVLDQDRVLRHRVVERLVVLLREDRVVLVREQRVALAADERLQRLASAVVLHGDMILEQFL